MTDRDSSGGKGSKGYTGAKV